MLSGLCAQTNTKEKRFPLNNDMPNNSNYIYLLSERVNWDVKMKSLKDIHVYC